MQRTCSNWKGAAPLLASLLILAIGADTGRAGTPLAKTDPPQPLPGDRRHRLEERPGPRSAGCGLDNNRFPVFVEENKGKPGRPAGVFASQLGKRAALAKLPVPASAFGLDLGETQVTDAGLKEGLAGPCIACKRYQLEIPR